MNRVKDIALADHVSEAEQSWWSVLLPVSMEVGRRVSRLDLSGATISCFQHLTMVNAATMLPLIESGARLRVAAVNPDSTDDIAAAYLAAHGAEVWAWSRMTNDEVREGLEWLLSERSDAISDMGGECIAAHVGSDASPVGALEATTSGLHRLAGLSIPFPVFDWNSIPLKDRLHNRHHVGLTAWPAFSKITGLALYGRSVLVIGFGPVGRGVAMIARSLGAAVSVTEVDPVRALEAQHHGFPDVALEDGLASNSIVVTATGIEGVLGPDHLRRLPTNAILVNVGHSNREIDVDWLERQPHESIRPSIDRITIDDRAVFLINRGSLVNLAPEAHGVIEEYFDPFAAIILYGLAWIVDSGVRDGRPGIQPYPKHLEREIAALTRGARN
jgi:adenosylhomocysteinase